ncbi:CLUMA_CG004668, isoform A [Clunio marinus]|uniref:CLUMA_CG004668, isoform A n=1 Tax=Clunio marinus TaxID=568069 RepID=A0A1J1HSL6_9DIPT|nr:CLUMA_CG004668, isoform A [Clunio marinus]
MFNNCCITIEKKNEVSQDKFMGFLKILQNLLRGESSIHMFTFIDGQGTSCATLEESRFHQRKKIGGCSTST